jgi:hypothetical protein
MERQCLFFMIQSGAMKVDRIDVRAANPTHVRAITMAILIRAEATPKSAAVSTRKTKGMWMSFSLASWIEEETRHKTHQDDSRQRI